MARSRSIAGFPPPGPVTPATCIPSRPQVYRAPSDLKVQQLHGLNVLRYHNGVARGVPMACPGTKLLGCAFDIQGIRSGTVAYASMPDIPWTTARADRANAGFAGRRRRRGRNKKRCDLQQGTVVAMVNMNRARHNLPPAAPAGAYLEGCTAKERRSAYAFAAEMVAAANRKRRGSFAGGCPQNVNDMRYSCQGYMGGCPQNVNDMRFSCQGYMGMMTPPGEDEGIELLLPRLLAGMRAVYMTLQTAHWQSSGEGYYGKHELLQKIYEEIEEGYDSLAERAVLYLGPWAVDPVQQNAWIGQCLQRWVNIECPIDRSYAAALDFRDRLEMTHAILQARDELSLGMENYLGEIAAGHDQHLYLLQRAAARPTPKGHYMGAPSFPSPPTTCEERCAGVPKSQWLACLAKCGGGPRSVAAPAAPRALPPARRMHWASPSVNRPVATPQQGQVATNLVPVRGGVRHVWRQR